MEKKFVPYEFTKALQDLGFDKPCLATIDQTGFIHIKGTKSPSIRGDMFYEEIDCPLWQDVFDWFEENGIEIFFYKNEHNKKCFRVEYGSWDFKSETLTYATNQELRIDAVRMLIAVWNDFKRKK